MIVICFIQAVIAVMLLLIEVKKRGNSCSAYVRVRSQIFIVTALLQLSKFNVVGVIHYNVIRNSLIPKF